jgi:hypothetical protein
MQFADKFDLYKHYDIDTLDARHQTWFNLKFKERSFNKCYLV